ncbi:MAG TPA: hypothetical protein QF564_21635 [Pirellulaceae bacterium]|nr:hypothetical protein [Pirellulaceae bacterium]
MSLAITGGRGVLGRDDDLDRDSLADREVIAEACGATGGPLLPAVGDASSTLETSTRGTSIGLEHLGHLTRRPA